MRHLDPNSIHFIDHTNKLLNRLARRARRHGLSTMIDSLNRAQWRIWAMQEERI